MKINFIKKFGLNEEVKTNLPLLTSTSRSYGTGRMVKKFGETKHKAEFFDEKMIKQYQFDRDNKDEEENFLELVNVLQSKI